MCDEAQSRAKRRRPQCSASFQDRWPHHVLLRFEGSEKYRGPLCSRRPNDGRAKFLGKVVPRAILATDILADPKIWMPFTYEASRGAPWGLSVRRVVTPLDNHDNAVRRCLLPVHQGPKVLTPGLASQQDVDDAVRNGLKFNVNRAQTSCDTSHQL